MINKKGRPPKENTQEMKKLKKEVVAFKLQNPNYSFREIAKKFSLSPETVRKTIYKELKNENINYDSIIENSKKIVEKGQKFILEKIDKLDIKNQSDLNLLTSSLKNSMALIWMIENTQNTNKSLIPLNINLSINNNTDNVENVENVEVIE